MPDNQTWTELVEADEEIISATDGVLITSLDHRTSNKNWAEYMLSFQDFSTELTADNQLTSLNLKKRDVSKILIIEENLILGKIFFTKSPNWAGTVLNLTNGVSYPAGTKITISFEKDRTAP